mmetsp:Transcript_55680/g.113374  ORF Transcript_55680/g.113374 Transcript_55680/m.113374 type:complete len:211 (-) Transcript_55680:488-1120(-)
MFNTSAFQSTNRFDLHSHQASPGPPAPSCTARMGRLHLCKSRELQYDSRLQTATEAVQVRGQISKPLRPCKRLRLSRLSPPQNLSQAIQGPLHLPVGDVQVLPQHHHCEVLLLIDPDGHLSVAGGEDTATMRPVSAGATGLEPLLLKFIHATCTRCITEGLPQWQVNACDGGSKAPNCLCDQHFDLGLLFPVHGWQEAKAADVPRRAELH